MKKNSPSYVPVVESVPTPVMPAYGRHEEAGHVPTSITDALTIGEEATVFRPVQRALRPTGWAVAHVNSLDAAIAYLKSNVAAVVVAEAESVPDDWKQIVSSLRALPDAPEVVLVGWNELSLQDALDVGAFDLLQRPFDHSDLLWAVATAWHNWMSRRERVFGGGSCSDA